MNGPRIKIIKALYVAVRADFGTCDDFGGDAEPRRGSGISISINLSIISERAALESADLDRRPFTDCSSDLEQYETI